MTIRKTAVLALSAALVATSGFSQEEEGAAEEKKAAETAAPATPAKAVSQVKFSTLPLCRLIEGAAEAKLPNGEWGAAEEGKFYPLGTLFRTKQGSRLVLTFGGEAKVTLAENSAFGTRLDALGTKDRAIVLMQGVLDVSLPDNMPEGAFTVTAPGFTVRNPAGDSHYDYTDKGDGDTAVVRCVTGSLSLEGRHFEIPTMRAADEVIISTTHDFLVTELRGTSGDYAVKLDQGVATKMQVGDDGTPKPVVSPAKSEWRLSPKTRVLICRSVPAIGERMSVHTMAFDAAGEMKSECCFCEGRAEINSGELVAKEKSEADELAKRAAEAAETTEATDADEEEPAENNDNKQEESKEE